MSRLTGRRAVVLGAGRGIGAAIARAYAAEGAGVVVASRTATDVQAVSDEIATAGGRAFAVAADVRDTASIAALASTAAEALDGPVDILVNSAGRYEPRAFLDYELEHWSEMVDVNLLGTVRAIRSVLPAMIEIGRGRIINIASTAGKYGTANQSAYNASKHAVLGLTRSLALEVARQGVRVNAICPGWVDTELIQTDALSTAIGVEPDEVAATLARRAPIGRFVRPEEVAALAVYLAADESDAMTGIGLTLAGGLILI